MLFFVLKFIDDLNICTGIADNYVDNIWIDKGLLKNIQQNSCSKFAQIKGYCKTLYVFA